MSTAIIRRSRRGLVANKNTILFVEKKGRGVCYCKKNGVACEMVEGRLEKNDFNAHGLLQFLGLGTNIQVKGASCWV